MNKIQSTTIQKHEYDYIENPKNPVIVLIIWYINFTVIQKKLTIKIC